MGHGVEKVYLNASIVFATLTAALFTGLGFTTNPQLAPILAILSGMTTMGALTAFQRYLELNARNPLLRASFNESFLSTVISTVIREAEAGWKLADSQIEKRQVRGLPPWAIAPSRLVGVDNAMALASLRMYLEYEVRRIAHEAKLAIPEPAPSLNRLSEALVAAGILPAQLLEPLNEVADVCNRGVHGETIPNELAASVVRIGDQLLEGLRTLAVKQTT